MYRSITFSWKRLNPAEDIPRRLRFEGFDGNNEPDLRNYVQYFVIELGRFEELTYGQKFPRFNSHTRMLEIYKKRLAVWKQYDFDLTPKQITSILEV